MARADPMASPSGLWCDVTAIFLGDDNNSLSSTGIFNFNQFEMNSFDCKNTKIGIIGE
jgi:hypothetical protein